MTKFNSTVIAALGASTKAYVVVKDSAIVAESDKAAYANKRAVKLDGVVLNVSETLTAIAETRAAAEAKRVARAAEKAGDAAAETKGEAAAEAKPAARPGTVNLHGIKFGKSMSTVLAEEYCEEIFRGRFELSEVEYDGHYWWANVTELDADGFKIEAIPVGVVRLDYLLNYERLPKAIVNHHKKTATIARKAAEAKAASEKAVAEEAKKAA